MKRILPLDLYDPNSLIYVSRTGVRILEVFDKNRYGEWLEVRHTKTADHRVALTYIPFSPNDILALCEDV